MYGGDIAALGGAFFFLLTIALGFALSEKR